MAIMVREIVEEIIESFPSNAEIDVDLIEDMKNHEIDRIDIVNALKGMEEEGFGVFWKGRRGKKTRFIKGAKRVPIEVEQQALNKLRQELIDKPKDFVMLASYEDSLQKADDIYKEELKQFENQIDAASFFNGKIAKAVDALKFLQEEKLGVFVIGRRGKFSRFICGISKDELKTKPKGIILKTDEEKHEQKQKKYNVIQGVVFPTINGNFTSIKEAVENAGIADISFDIIAAEIDKYGYFSKDVYLNRAKDI